MSDSSNVATSSTEVDYNARDEDGNPEWLKHTGPKKDSVLRSKRVGLRSYRPLDQPSKADLRALAAAAAKSFPITRID